MRNSQKSNIKRHPQFNSRVWWGRFLNGLFFSQFLFLMCVKCDTVCDTTACVWMLMYHSCNTNGRCSSSSMYNWEVAYLYLSTSMMCCLKLSKHDIFDFTHVFSTLHHCCQFIKCFSNLSWLWWNPVPLCQCIICPIQVNICNTSIDVPHPLLPTLIPITHSLSH